MSFCAASLAKVDKVCNLHKRTHSVKIAEQVPSALWAMRRDMFIKAAIYKDHATLSGSPIVRCTLLLIRSVSKGPWNGFLKFCKCLHHSIKVATGDGMLTSSENYFSSPTCWTCSRCWRWQCTQQAELRFSLSMWPPQCCRSWLWRPHPQARGWALHHQMLQWYRLLTFYSPVRL